jgi:hypothetical protein
MGVETSYDIIASYNNELAKKLSKYIPGLETKSAKAICGNKDGINMFACKIEDNRFELICEHPHITDIVAERMNELQSEFYEAYIDSAINQMVRKIENTGLPTKIEKEGNQRIVLFGPAYEYSVIVSFDGNSIQEEVSGVKGDFCLSLTEELENLLSHPNVDIETTYKECFQVQVEDKSLQVLKLEFQ